ncbi:putative hydrolase, alpha/beta fold LipV [Actinokineospora globicatena]|uniref:Hydrolase, alpha/beta fold LipV n=2 Tax=Actinokineospora globicatena TaxID=103729 RepID=A0A9W6QQ56_9PSEU|nr:putative hydrolase, alpha/beta fold LipV [Actinokineospora globicatena]
MMRGMADALNVHVFGPPDAPPLLALHGVTGHGGRYRALAERQLPGYRVIAPDLRGHGHSPALPPWTLEQHVADVLAVIETFGLDAPPVVAHSFGGLIALHLPRHRVGDLVLLDPAVSVRPQDALAYAENAAATASDPVAAQRGDWPAAPDEVVAEEVAAHWTRVDGGWRPRYCPPAVATAWSEMCRPVPAPTERTLVVRALRAPYVGPEFLAGAGAAKVVDLDCGHVVYVDAPERVGALVTDFLEG